MSTQPESEAFVRFSELQKSYDGETLVIKNLNLDIARGEFLTMLGPSGSGKTTCLMMLAGFETATHGEIFLDGQPINNVAPHRRNIGMVFQNYALFPHMTVSENLRFPLEVRKVTRSEVDIRVQRALDMVELGAYGNRKPAQLSGGQQQRVAVARALVFEPKLVLMDEPLGALDKQLREQMQYEIKHIHEQLGVTIVYVTHDQGEALTMSNRIAVFSDGEIQQLSTPSGLYERPENAFVAQFIGENNRLSGTVRGIDGEIQQLSTPSGLYERPENAFVAQFIGENNRLSGTVRGIDGELCAVEVGDGQTVKALKVNAAGAGTNTTLSLRPERVVVWPEPGSVPNIFNARVEEIVYLGDHMRTRVSVLGHQDFVIKAPNSGGAISMQAGDEISIGWQAKDCRALDA